MSPPVGHARVQREVPKTRPAPAKKRKIYVWKRGAFFNFFALCATLLAVLVILNLMQRALIAQDALKVQKLRNSVQGEKTRQERLFLKRTKLNSPRRIEKIALEKLKMVAPAQVHYLVLPPDISDDPDSSEETVYLSAYLNLRDKTRNLPR